MRRRRGVAQRPVPVVHRRLSPTPSATHRPQIPSEATDKEDSLSSENESNLPKEDRFPVPIVNQEEIARLRRKNALDILNSALGTSFDLDMYVHHHLLVHRQKTVSHGPFLINKNTISEVLRRLSMPRKTSNLPNQKTGQRRPWWSSLCNKRRGKNTKKWELRCKHL